MLPPSYTPPVKDEIYLAQAAVVVAHEYFFTFPRTVECLTPNLVLSPSHDAPA